MVKSPQEIAETLDENGALDGLPFMPEMLEHCGKRYRVLRRAGKACVEFPTRYWIRELRGNDVVILEGLRCSGVDHDGCQRACVVFWKTEWLRKADNNTVNGAPINEGVLAGLRARLKTKTSQERYFCQSTEMANATQHLTKIGILRNCYADVASGSRGVVEMVGLICAPLWRKATKKIPRRKLKGALKRTPVGDLGLQPGELIQIKSEQEIAKTLDEKGRNRGLICDLGMTQYAGGQYRVRTRLDRMISESTGQMRKVEGTVILEGLECLCWRVAGGCPRQDYMYWRELWLERMEQDVSGNKKNICVDSSEEVLR